MSAQTRVSQQSVQESTSHGAMTARRRGRRGRPRPRRRRGGDLDQEEKEGGGRGRRGQQLNARGCVLFFRPPPSLPLTIRGVLCSRPLFGGAPPENRTGGTRL